MCTHVYMHVGTQVVWINILLCMHACRSPKLTLGVFLNQSTFYLLRQGLSCTQSFPNPASQAGELVPGIS